MSIEFKMGTLGNVGAAVKIIDFTAEYSEHEVPLPAALEEHKTRIVKQIAENGQKVSDGPNLSLQKWEPTTGAMHFSYCPSSYFKLLATHRSLDTSAENSDKTIRMLYGDLNTMINPYDYSRSSYSKAVGLSGVVVTADNKIIVVKRSNQVAIEPNSWHVSLAEGMKTGDIDERGKITPFATVKRAVREELQDTSEKAAKLSFSKTRILALGISQKYLQPQFLMRMDSPLTASVIIEHAEKSRGRWERSRMKAIDFYPEAILKMLKEEQWSPHGEMALLALLKDEQLIG